ncbi:protein FAM136A-like [Convolutriloba macropyga]|uniref:protein FAM136A-like n=1 Tax=Convolutriloba macropyga TaxID=536237 RepID=UPI003F51E623
MASIEIDQLQRKMQSAVEDMMNRIDKIALRSMQRSAFLCAADCCSNVNDSSISAQNCVDRCQQPVISSQRVVETEINDLQSRLARAAAQCQDRVKDKYSLTDNSNQSAAIRDMEQCMTSAANDILNNLPNIEKRILHNLKK